MNKLFVFMLMVIATPLFAEPTANPPDGASPTLAPKKKEKEKRGVSKDDSGDTYNFYFQKGSGPGSVEQGGAQKVEGAAPSATPQEDEEVPKFEGHLGLVIMPASSGSGFSVGGQFNATRRFGLQVHLLSLTGETDGGKSSSFSASGTEDRETKLTSIGGSIAATFTPYTFNERSFPVRLSFLGGAMRLSTTREETVSTFSASGSNDTTNASRSSRVLPFVGVSATAKIAKHFGLVGYGKITTEADYSQVGLSAAWLF